MSGESSKKNLLFLLGAFTVAFIFGPLRQHHGLDLVPGDFGDARLNNYFLENIYQFLIGNSSSLIHLNFFSFFPYVGGFSDNLYGASPIYLFFRGLTGESDTAFQLWFYLSYAANYFSAYWALRLLGIKPLAATFGALIFSFALPVSSKTLHAQLGYRFSVPLVIAYFYLFLERGNIRLFLYAMAWLVWGFYCSIYIGIFTAFFVTSMAIVFLCINAYKKTHLVSDHIAGWRKLSLNAWLAYGLSLTLLLAIMLVLMYPYIEVTLLYGFKRNYGEISNMLPSIQSYFFADLSLLWSSYSKLLADVPMRYEQQMFIGIIPCALVIFSFFIPKGKGQVAYWTIGGALLFVVLCTLKVGGYSLWELFSKLPLLSSLRAVSRIILVLLFPFAYLCSLSIDYLQERKGWLAKAFILLLLAGIIVESSLSNTYVAFPKEAWRLRLQNAEARLPKDIPADAVLFFAQKSEAPHIDELDAMWASMAHSRPTLNGYSGNFPLGYQFNFGSNCLELPRRVAAYLNFTKQLNSNSYSEFMQRVVPIGFDGCQFARFGDYPQITIANKPYPAGIFKNLSISFVGGESFNGFWKVSVDVKNDNNEVISASSSSGNPISLSYRFLDKEGNPISNWDPRTPLWSDIPSQGTEHLQLDIPKNVPLAQFIEFSLVQDGIFWSHDLGVIPKRVALSNMKILKSSN
jgi:hypothetical protein